jgi:hypothetical protein
MLLYEHKKIGLQEIYVLKKRKRKNSDRNIDNPKIQTWHE